MKPLLLNIIICINLNIISTPIFAQEVPNVLNFSKNEYHAQNQNWDVTQGPDYFMYFANSDGLLEFDGTVWKTWPLPDNQIIRSVNSDNKGRIYTGAFNEFGYWEKDSLLERHSKKLKYRSLISMVDFEKMGKEEIWHILVKDEFVLFQSFSTIYLFDGKKITVQEPPGNIMFTSNVNGKLLFQVIGSGLFEFKGDNDFELVPGTGLLATKTVACILPHSSESFLVGTAHQGVFKYEKGKLTTWNEQIHNIISPWQLNKGIQLSNGNYAFGTILNGVFILDQSGNIIYHINQLNGLQNNTVLALKEDKATNLWLGLDKGIDLVELNSPLTFFKDKNGVLGTVYSASLFKNHLYIGTNQGVFFKKWTNSDPLQTSDFQLVEGTQGQVWELTIQEGQLICGHNDGTFLINGSVAKKISDITGAWMTIPHPQFENILLQATYTGIVVLKNSNSFGGNHTKEWQFSHRINGFIEPVKELFIDKKGNLWTTNPNKGLYRIQLDSSLKNITNIFRFSEMDGLVSEFNIDLETIPLQNNDNLLLIQSNNQLLTFDEKTNRFQSLKNRYSRYNFGNDLFGNEHVFKIKSGWNGDWFRITPDKITLVNDNVHSTFFISLIPRYENIVPLDSNTYLFCLDNGYVILKKPFFSPGRKTTNKNDAVRSPSLLFSEVEIFGKNPRKILLPNDSIRRIIFAPDENHIRFNFTQPVFTQNPKFSYQLEGFEETWMLIENGNSKEFTNLQNGDYVFRVKSNLSNKIISLPFTIRPHWYETSMAMWLYFLGLSIITFLFLTWHQRRLYKQRKILEEEAGRQLEEQRIMAANENLQKVVILKSKELANSTMNLVQKNEILLQIKNELKRLKQLSSGQLPAKVYRNLLHTIDVHLTSNQDWELFEKNFNQVHEQFFKKMKIAFPQLTPGELRLAAYLKMNLSSKDIAPLLNISIRGVENKRYRLRKKLGLPVDANLVEFMMAY